MTFASGSEAHLHVLSWRVAGVVDRVEDPVEDPLAECEVVVVGGVVGDGGGDEPFNILSNALTRSPLLKSLEFVLKNRASGIRSRYLLKPFATKVPHYYDNLPPQCIWIYLYERFAAEIAMLFPFSKEYGTHFRLH